MASAHQLRQINRYITTNNDDCKAIFDTTVPPEADWHYAGSGAEFFLGYVTSKFPVPLENGADISRYKHYQENKPGVIVRGGTVLRVVDMAPGSLSPMHRTVSLDYGVVLEGEIECVLDSGETRLLQRGDIVIQRATNHAWRNVGKTWARMLYVLQESEKVTINGKDLGEDYGHGIEGVPPSS